MSKSTQSIPSSYMPLGNEIWIRPDGTSIRLFQMDNDELSVTIESVRMDIDELIDAQIFCHEEGDIQGFHDIQADLDVYFQWLVVLQTEQRARYLGMDISQRYHERRSPPQTKYFEGVSYTVKDNIVQINFGFLKHV